MIRYFKENYVGPNLLADYGAIFSASKDDILLNSKEYYQEMLPSFDKRVYSAT